MIIRWIKWGGMIMLSYIILSLPTSQGTLYAIMQRYSGPFLQRTYRTIYQIGSEQCEFMKNQFQKFFLNVEPLSKNSSSDQRDANTVDSSLEFMEKNYRRFHEFNQKKMIHEKETPSVEEGASE